MWRTGMRRIPSERRKSLSNTSVTRASGSYLTHMSRRTSIQLNRAVEREGAIGIVRAARVESTAYVAHVGLTYTGALAAEEVRLAHQCPERQYRYQAIVDSYAGMVASTIAKMGLER